MPLYISRARNIAAVDDQYFQHFENLGGGLSALEIVAPRATDTFCFRYPAQSGGGPATRLGAVSTFADLMH